MSDFVFPSNPDDIKAIRKSLEDVSDSMTRIAGERDLIKETKKALKEKYSMKPKLITRLAKTMFNDDFDAGQLDNEEFVEAYKKVVGK